MSASLRRQCLHCGFTLDIAPPELHDRRPAPCPKCDSDLFAQSDGSVLTQDIAHAGETVPQALAKLERVLEEALAGYSREVRLITGGGLIREEALGQLTFLQREARILSFREEGRNRGAVLVRLRD